MTSKQSSLPPYPRLGEGYRLLAGAFDTKASNRDVDKWARDGDYDWSLLPRLRKELFTDPLEKSIDNAFAGLVTDFVEHVQKEFVRLLMHVPLDSLDRREALELLTEHFFVPMALQYFIALNQHDSGLDLAAFLHPDNHPLDVVFSWAEAELGLNTGSLQTTVYPGSTGEAKSKKDQVSRWRNGGIKPGRQTISLVCRDIKKKFPQWKKGSRNLANWLLTARALMFLEHEAESILPLRRHLLRELLADVPQRDIGRILSLANAQASPRLQPLVLPGLKLADALNPGRVKSEGDQARTKEVLEAFRLLVQEQDPDGRTCYFLEWCTGRWYVMSGQPSVALKYYGEAVKSALYRAGNNQKRILKEALVVAAHLHKRPFLRRLKNQAIAFGLFHDGGNTGTRVIEDWEIKGLERAFSQVFPPRGRFLEAKGDEAPNPLPVFMTDWESLRSKGPDLRHPDRIISIRSVDGQKKRMPQLCRYAWLGDYEAVKSLIRHGANVDQLDKSGASALLYAIQHAEMTGSRDVLDLLLEQAHRPETINSKTKAKQLTPLLCAIGYGEPDVVAMLLVKGATPDLRGKIVGQTPLYYCLERMGRMSDPDRSRRELSGGNPLRNDAVTADARRRYGDPFAGVFGELRIPYADPDNPRHMEIQQELTKKCTKPRVQIHNLAAIARLLVKNGADPNAVHSHPVQGWTPLMLAAEIDAVDVFVEMIECGGDPCKQDAEGLDCWKIALGFGSSGVVRCLKETG